MIHLLSSPASQSSEVAAELTEKLAIMRRALAETGAKGLRLRGIDWLTWATAGSSLTVLLAADTGIAEVFVTSDRAYILTSDIEAQRLQDEELTHGIYEIYAYPWAETAQPDQFVQSITTGELVISDRPTAGESALPPALIQAKRVLLPGEIDRYRQVGRLASEAMTEAMLQAQPDWTEYQLAGVGAKSLWSRGLEPALILVAGERRAPVYRHPIATAEAIGRRGMMVFCARGFGLYANLTRWVAFGGLSSTESTTHAQVREIEAIALNQNQPDVPLHQIYHTLQQAYEQRGYPDGIHKHHQGGTTGYLSREIVATPQTSDRLLGNTAVAWNPSLPGAKIEDTFLLHADGTLENLTFDPNWVSVEVEGRSRPIPLEIL